MDIQTIGGKYTYSLKDGLGSGAFAEVFKGKNILTGEDIAIKAMKKAILKKHGNDLIEQIKSEIQILTNLVNAMKLKNCPFINKIYDCIETDIYYFIVLEFCEGGTLLDVLSQKKKLSEPEAILILFEIVSALAFISENNVVHRDIKPENILIKQGIYKLGDFGFASQKSLYQTHLGTYPYMAPEFFNSQTYDAAIDIWALGNLFHQMLFGEIYFIGHSQYDVSQKILNLPYQLKQGQNASNDVKDVLYRMIEKDKSKRITAVQLLNHQIFNNVRNSQDIIEIYNKEHQLMSRLQALASNQNENLLVSELQQKLLISQTDTNDNSLQIVSGINQIRDGAYLMLELTEYLKQYFLLECRYDIFYIFKAAIIQVNKLKEKIDRQYHFTQKDHISFANINEDQWKSYYSNINNDYLTQREQLQADKSLIQKHYIQFFNYITKFTSSNYQEHTQNLSEITNFNFQEVIAPELYVTQLFNKIKFFKQEHQRVQDSQQKFLIQKVIYWLYVAAKKEEMFQGTLVNAFMFSQAAKQNDLNGMRVAIQVI